MNDRFRMVPLIERKKRAEELTAEEIAWICQGFVAGEIPDYQVSAWLMAVCCRGMTEAETLALTRAFVASGASLEWSDLDRPVVDKHSTGGVGDKTSLVLVPLLAAAGLAFVKMSGRGLGHTGGTLDKLESIPGFSVNLSLEEIRAQVRRIGCALVGQGPELVPADGVLYALRDVTATVDAVPLIASSIMSKKLAAGAPVIVLDVKHGSGALMPSVEHARELAAALVAIGTGAGRKVRAVLSPMEQPLGEAVGNALEIQEVVETLAGDGPADLWDLTVELGSHLLILSGAAASREEAAARLGELRDSGAGLARLVELVEAQGGDGEVIRDPTRLPAAAHVESLAAPADGWIARVDAREVAEVALELGGGRRQKTDEIDHAVGVRLRRRIGDRVEAGEPLAEIHAPSQAAATQVADRLAAAFGITPDRPQREPVTFEVIG